jgi:hypothetical protein
MGVEKGVRSETTPRSEVQVKKGGRGNPGAGLGPEVVKGLRG